MFCWIPILGGLLIMMGQHDRSEALFYYFRLEDQVPETHLLRLIDKHISFEFVRQQLKDSYSETGRPSIDPELLLRILLIGYLYGITSERRLVEELRMHLAWRWFTGLGFDQEIPHHSTFSKNRHGRFQESKLFEQLFEQIVRQCVEVGLVQGQHLSVDGSFVEANAAKQSRIPREQLAEAARVNHNVRQYLREVEEQNRVEEPVHEQDQVSTTDPDSTYATKGGTPARLGYYDNYLVDNASCVIVGVQATAARMSQETVAAQDMLTRFAEWQARAPESVAADTTYGNGEFLQWLADRNITPYMRTRDSIHRKRSPFFGPERFTYEPEHNRYICPAGQVLNYGGRVYRNRAFNYIGTRKKCGACSLRPQCTSAAFRGLIIHQNEPARQRARELVNTPEFTRAQRQRKKVEALFAELKNQIGLRRLRLRRLRFVREQFFLAAAAQNLKRFGAVPEPNHNPYDGSRLLAEVKGKLDCSDNRGEEFLPITDFFNTHFTVALTSSDATLAAPGRRSGSRRRVGRSALRSARSNRSPGPTHELFGCYRDRSPRRSCPDRLLPGWQQLRRRTTSSGRRPRPPWFCTVHASGLPARAASHPAPGW
jgi:transposase